MRFLFALALVLTLAVACASEESTDDDPTAAPSRTRSQLAPNDEVRRTPTLDAETFTPPPTPAPTAPPTPVPTDPPTAPPPPPPTQPPAPVIVTEPPAPQPACDPSYPTVCIPPYPPDLDCGDITHRKFTVLPPDPHGFDGNDKDGVGCES